MDALTLLKHRRSSKKFGDKVPTPEQLEQIIQAGLRAPDHGRLKPYQFIVIEPSAMATLHQHLQAVAEELALGEKGLEKAQKLSQRAPMMIAVVAKVDPNVAKVPEWEQIVTAGCATYAMQLAANALGFETCWITNKWVKGSSLRQAFGCGEHDQIVALVMIGSPLDSDQITLANQAEATSNFVRYLK